MNFLINKFKDLDEDTKDVFINSSSTMLVQIVGISARLLTSIFLGRTLGTSGLGSVNLINQIITVFLVVSMFGMDHVIIKKISIGISEKNYSKVGQTIFTSLVVNILIASILTIIGILFAKHFSQIFFEGNLNLPIILSLLVIVPQTIGVVFASALNGFNLVWQSRMLKDFSTSIFVLFGLLLIWSLNLPINILNVIVVYIVSRLLTFLLSFIYLKKIYKPLFITGFIDKSMIHMAKPLLFASAAMLLSSSVDILMLGWLSNSSDVGLYTVAARLVLFISFFLQITNSAISPKIASLFANKEIQKINIMVKQVTLVLIIIGFVSTLFFLFLGESILMLWGTDFVKAYYCLAILCFGQFINISTGCSGILLIMSGNEKVFSYISGIFLLINITLNYFFINSYGIEGAALATSLSIAGENIFRVILVKRKTGILTTPFGINRIKKNI